MIPPKNTKPVCFKRRSIERKISLLFCAESGEYELAVSTCSTRATLEVIPDSANHLNSRYVRSSHYRDDWD
jgi:hypothetical protein